MCEISRDQMCGKFQDIPSKVEVKLLYLASPVTQKKNTMPIWILKATYTSFR